MDGLYSFIDGELNLWGVIEVDASIMASSCLVVIGTVDESCTQGSKEGGRFLSGVE